MRILAFDLGQVPWFWIDGAMATLAWPCVYSPTPAIHSAMPACLRNDSIGAVNGPVERS
jgi:hypothetical protein